MRRLTKERLLSTATVAAGLLACFVLLFLGLGPAAPPPSMIVPWLVALYSSVIMIMAVVFYTMLVGVPSWNAMKERWHWLHQVHYRY